MREMTWEEKLAALKAITPTHLEMRAPGNWFVSALAREVPNGSMLHGIYGNGDTPQHAVENDWEQISTQEVVAINAHGENDRRVRWNGFMWEDVKFTIAP